MSDTYQFSVHNPAEACMDITGVRVQDMEGTGTAVLCVENDTTNYDFTSVKYLVDVKNTGEETGTANVKLKDDAGNVLEEKSQDIAGGDAVTITFDNAGAGYSLADGETKTYTAEVTP